MMARPKLIEPEWEPTTLEAQEIALGVRDLVERERARGERFKNEDGRYVRLDTLDRLRGADRLTVVQWQAGKRYQRQHAAFYENDQYRSTLEYSRSARPVGEFRLAHGQQLVQVQREALDGLPALIAIADKVCGRDEVPSGADLARLRVTLDRLVGWYADELPESELIKAAPRVRSLRDRASEIATDWRGSEIRSTFDSRRQFALLLALLWEAQGEKCGICGTPMERGGLSLDHVRPKYRDGPDEPGNLLAAHPGCNKRKGSALPRRFEMQMLRSVNLILGWEEEELEPEELTLQRLSDAISRLNNPAPSAPVRAKRWTTPLQLIEAPPSEPRSYLEKPSRGENHMHEKWLAGQGVLKSNRTMRARGVNAGSRRK